MTKDTYSFAFPIDTILTHPTCGNENLRIIETTIEVDKDQRISKMYHVKGTHGADKWIDANDLETEGKVVNYE